jgi:glycosyltransferase involved in cell wall biosynthesis
MRIAYLLTSLGIGGAEKQVVMLADRMARRGHTVAILVLLPRQPEQWPTELPVHYLEVDKSPGGLIRALLRARGTLYRFRPDILHSHTFYANMTARLLRCMRAAPRVISTIHNVYEGGYQRMLAYRATDFLSLHATAVSQAAAERFVALRAVPREKISVIPNAIDPDEFQPDPKLRQHTRAALTARDDFIWLAAGRMTDAKDFPNLLRAFAQVSRNHPKSQLWIAGEEASHDGHSRKAAPLAIPPDAASRVRLLGLRRDMPSLLNAADAFVLSSAWEGMPLVVGEAMSTQKLIVATDVGGVRELLSDTGSIVPARDSASLAAAMTARMELPHEQLVTLGRSARQRILKCFNLDDRTSEWEAFYSSFLSLSR